MRCFVGAFLEPGSASAVSRLVPEVEGFRQVDPKNLHVTLLFIGERTEDQARDAARQVRTLGACSLRCELKALTGLPLPSRASALVVELRPHPALSAWHAALTERLGPTDRRFRPHVTLGRSRRPRAVTVQPLKPGIHVNLQPPALYLSETLPGGARYSKIPFS